MQVPVLTQELLRKGVRWLLLFPLMTPASPVAGTTPYLQNFPVLFKMRPVPVWLSSYWIHCQRLSKFRRLSTIAEVATAYYSILLKMSRLTTRNYRMRWMLLNPANHQQEMTFMESLSAFL